MVNCMYFSFQPEVVLFLSLWLILFSGLKKSFEDYVLSSCKEVTEPAKNCRRKKNEQKDILGIGVS